MAGIHQRVLGAGEKIRILIVDDSVVIRRLLMIVLAEDPDLDVVGVAPDGDVALDRIAELKPDVVTLDVEMPRMNGLDVLRHIRADYPSLRVIMFSTVTRSASAITLEALSLGADDYVTKASNEGGLDRSLARLRDELIPKIKQFFRRAGTATRPFERVTCVPRVALSSPFPRIVAIGVSTGGPVALTQVLPQLPVNFPLPVLVVQHMPALFTQLLADRLNASCRLAVHEAKEGDLVEAGQILIAPGDFHMTVVSQRGNHRIHLDQSPRQHSCRPSVDVLFRSLADTYGGAVTAVILTGMGQDGLRGADMLRAKGAYVIAQDESTSVVWGMAGAVVQAGLADAVVPLDRVTDEILRKTAGARVG